MLKAAEAGVTIEPSGDPGAPLWSERAMLLPATAWPTALPPMETVRALASPALADDASGPTLTLSPPIAVPNAVPPPMANAVSDALPLGPAMAVPVASPPPMATVMSLTLLPPVVVPVASPPMETVRLAADPPDTLMVPVALHPWPMATVKLSFGPLPWAWAV